MSYFKKDKYLKNTPAVCSTAWTNSPKKRKNFWSAVLAEAVGARQYEVNDINDLTALAEEYNCEVIMGKRDLLLLDIDDGRWEEWKLELIKQIYPDVAFVVQDIWASRSNTGYHVVIKMTGKVPNFLGRSWIAMALGSDPIREACAARRYKGGLKEPHRLLKPRR